jgi:hypothetical protein
MLFNRVESQPELTRKSSRAEEAVARTMFTRVCFYGVFLSNYVLRLGMLK